MDIDELAYSAYVNALIDGRPRRNDPYTGKDNSQFENLFSIQFLPAYAVALPAKVLRVSAATAFIILLPVATVAATVMLLWLLVEVTQELELSIVGAIAVLCLGTVSALNPVQILWGMQPAFDFFPFLRRYEPAIPFPVLIALSLFMWRALTRNPAWAILVGVSFGFLVYSYFFLWTAAAVWICAIMILWFIARPQDRRRVWQVGAIVLAIAAIVLVPYSWLLMHRPPTIDQAHLLEITHNPDLFRAPEIYGILVLCGLAYYARRGLQSWREPRVLFTASFALAPFLIFNQQVLTGRSMQPFHYEEFITNYWIVLALFLALGLRWRTGQRRILVYLLVGALSIAVFLAIRAADTRLSLNMHLDEGRLVALKLRADPGTLVFASDLIVTNSIDTVAPNPVLWARHLSIFSNVDLREQKKRFYQYLYYSGFNEKQLERVLSGDSIARWEVFGAERTVPVLTANHKRIAAEEISKATTEYAQFLDSFDSECATDPLLSYAVVSPEDDLSNLDRWYERSSPEKIGGFVVYHLRLRPSK
jgi:hypothetical protein